MAPPVSDRLLSLSHFVFVYHESESNQPEDDRQFISTLPVYELNTPITVISFPVSGENIPCEDYTRRLPPEVLGVIFLHLLKGPPYVKPRNAAPLILAHVCSRWRNIALSLPRLWCNLRIGGSRNDLALLEVWLQRSGTCTLSLKWDDLGSSEGNQQLWDTFISASSRWRQVDILLAFPSALNGIFSCPSHYFPLLDTLTLRVLQHVILSNASDSGFRSASNLRDVAIHGYASDNHFLLSAFPLAQMENLLIQGFHHLRSTTEYLEILSHLPKLRGFALKDAAWYGPSQYNSTKIVVLPMLEDLILDDVIDWVSFIQFTTLPQLRNIHISLQVCHPETEWPEQAFSSFLSRSSLCLDAPVQTKICTSMPVYQSRVPAHSLPRKIAYIGRLVSSATS